MTDVYPAEREQSDPHASRFTEAALERHKQEGLELAVRARWIALAVIAIMLPILNPRLEVIYFEAFLLVFAINGWLQRKVGRVGRSNAEFALLSLDIVLLTFVMVYPPPFSDTDWPTAVTYRFGNFIYFFVILAAGTLMYHWRTIMAFGHGTALVWGLGVVWAWYFGATDVQLGKAVENALSEHPRLLELLDPNSLQIDIRSQEIVVFAIVAYTRAMSSWRFHRLLLGNAALERERANLSRYFSPNVVDQLSQNDTPLREVREQDVAVLFVDLVGFTAYAADRPPREVIETLRGFHARMERCVFDHGGTLDKYLGDGLMATFGTPEARPDDVFRALDCARAMLHDVDELNTQRHADGRAPLAVSIGLHTGAVVLGDIGANRLEFAVIGNTVNVASRMEGLSRSLAARLVVSDAARAAALAQGAEVQDLARNDGQVIRGLPGTTTVWASG